MNQNTARYLQARFREYYTIASLQEPPDLKDREWGFVPFQGEGMRRHKSFSTRREMVDYIRAMVPAHVYHSAAYYQHADAPTMKEKGWKGADLIFDLDADHLRKRPKGYDQMLEMVKGETLKLLDYLQGDFGISSQHISVVFSGGRGYHIHVRDPKVIPLGSDSRREIVDYLTGRGLDLDRFFSRILVRGDCGVEKAESLRGPREDTPGWGGRINRGVQAFILYLRGLPQDEALGLLRGVKGIDQKRASLFYEQISSDQALHAIRGGNLDIFKGSSALWKILLRYLEEEGIQMAPFMEDLKGETDEPVTADIKRLIRFPESLHGGSGLRVTSLSLDSLKDFDPLRDAVVFGADGTMVAGPAEVKVALSRPYRLKIMNESFDLPEGEAELPIYAAVFLMARGVAELELDS